MEDNPASDWGAGTWDMVSMKERKGLNEDKEYTRCY